MKTIIASCPIDTTKLYPEDYICFQVKTKKGFLEKFGYIDFIIDMYHVQISVGRKKYKVHVDDILTRFNR